MAFMLKLDAHINPANGAQSKLIKAVLDQLEKIDESRSVKMIPLGKGYEIDAMKSPIEDDGEDRADKDKEEDDEGEDEDERDAGITDEQRSGIIGEIGKRLSSRGHKSTQTKEKEVRSAFANFVVGKISE